MFEKKYFKFAAALAAILTLTSTSALAQRERGAEREGREDRGLSCNDNWNSDRGSYCVIKEQMIQATGGTIVVDGSKNGGVSVKGWDRNEIYIRAFMTNGGVAIKRKS